MSSTYAAFGNVLISTNSGNKYVWKFKIKQMLSDANVRIGIASNVERRVSSKMNYCIGLDGSTWKNGMYMQRTGGSNLKWKENDTIAMEFDTELMQLSFLRYNHEKKTKKRLKFPSIDHNYYRMAVRMNNNGDKLKLINFQEIYQ